MASSTVENYLKQLFSLQQRAGQGLVPLGQLAERLSITPGTATIMVKRLAREGLVDYRSRDGARLSKEGEKLALNVLRRHRLVELFLVEVMQLDWSEIHEEAEVLEHAISDRLLDRMDEMLGRPTHDPHGDPIPTADGRIVPRAQTRLAQAEPGPAVVSRIIDTTATFLAFVDEQRLTPGTPITVQSRDPVADTVCLERQDGSTLKLGTTAAEKIYVAAPPKG